MTEDNILIVDDEPHVLAALKRAFISEPYKIFTAESAAEGLEILKTHRIKVVISDEKMPGMPGSEFLSIVRAQFPYAIRIMLTGHPNMDILMKSINDGELYRFITKPWDDIELRLIVRNALEKYTLEEANRGLIIKNFNTLYEMLRVIDPKTQYLCQCENCKKMIDMKFLYCPFCGDFRHDLCRVCNMPVETDWILCPFCGTPKKT